MQEQLPDPTYGQAPAKPCSRRSDQADARSLRRFAAGRRIRRKVAACRALSDPPRTDAGP